MAFAPSNVLVDVMQSLNVCFSKTVENEVSLMVEVHVDGPLTVVHLIDADIQPHLFLFL